MIDLFLKLTPYLLPTLRSCWFAGRLSVSEFYCISITGLLDHHHQLFPVFTRHHTPTHKAFIIISTLSSDWPVSSQKISLTDLSTILPRWTLNFQQIKQNSKILNCCLNSHPLHCYIANIIGGAGSLTRFTIFPCLEQHYITSDISPGPSHWWEHYLLFTSNRLELFTNQRDFLKEKFVHKSKYLST